MDDLFYPQGWTVSGLFNALSFAPEAITQHRVDDHHSFTASVRIPVITFLARAPYDNTLSVPGKTMVGGFLSRGQWVGPVKYFAPAIGLGYNYQISQHWGAGLNYEVGWYSVSPAQSFRAVSQAFLANFYHQL